MGTAEAEVPGIALAKAGAMDATEVEAQTILLAQANAMGAAVAEGPRPVRAVCQRWPSMPENGGRDGDGDGNGDDDGGW